MKVNGLKMLEMIEIIFHHIFVDPMNSSGLSIHPVSQEKKNEHCN